MPFDIGVPISGDVAIGLWFGAYNLGQRLHSRPAAAYAFHTAFFEENKVTPSLHSVAPSIHIARRAKNFKAPADSASPW